ncbi:MAG TPA: CpXC domain-containing protein [Caldimonas sp.]
MSVFRNETVNCPACATPVDFELVLSVNADRRPDLRDEIVAGTFQRRPCPSCGTEFRVDPEFTYMDLGHGQYIGVWPVAKRGQWQACAQKTAQTFDEALGKGASPEAKKLGARLEPRAVFGWPALAEKIIAREAGIDDRTLELAKVMVLRNGSETPVPGRRELRLVEARAEDFVLAWVRPADGAVETALRIPRTLIAEIDAEPEPWKAMRDSVGEGLVVDFQREMLAA